MIYMPKFSIIVPFHNAEEFMRKALDSITCQSYKDYEIIAICDRCKDNTTKIAEEYGCKVFETDFGSTGLSRSKGLDEAIGEYVLFMDHDDWWLHEFVLAQINEKMGQRKEDILQFGFIWKDKGYYSPNRLPSSQIYSNVWSKCFKREFIGDTRFKDIYYGDDDEFVGQLIQKLPVIVKWDMPLYYYNWLMPGSISERETTAGTLQETLYQFRVKK